MGIETGKRAVCDYCGTQTPFVAGSDGVFIHAILSTGWTVTDGWETLLCATCAARTPESEDTE